MWCMSLGFGRSFDATVADGISDQRSANRAPLPPSSEPGSPSRKEPHRMPDQHVIFRVVDARCTLVNGAIAGLPNVPIRVTSGRRLG